MKKKKDNIIHTRKTHFSVAYFLLILIVGYIFVNWILYATSSTIQAYEVTQGTIATNHIYRGFILRDEEVSYANSGGYLNYYAKNASKVAIDDVIYTIDTNGAISKEINKVSQDTSGLSEADIQDLTDQIDSFYGSYDLNVFSSVYSFKQEFSSDLKQKLSISALESLEKKIDLAESNQTFYRYTSSKPGIITYYVDGYESLTADEFSLEHMDMTGYQKTVFMNNEKVNAGEPVYKIVGSEQWQLMVHITEEMAKQLSERSYIPIRICKDNLRLNISVFEMKEIDGEHFVLCTIKTGMIRYLTDRYLEIEIVIDDNYGLKIPNSSIVEKEVYAIPHEYFTQGGNSSDKCLLIPNADGDMELVTPVFYGKSEEFYYVGGDKLTDSTIIYKPEEVSVHYQIGSQKVVLTGAYSINKGYAIFRNIKIISQNEDYAIIEYNTDYGLSLYDHIALDGKSIQENEIIYE